MDGLHEKLERLKENLKKLGRCAVAFSSGVDSAFLLKTAHEVLGDKVIALTAKACIFPGRESDEAVEFCKKEKIEQVVVDFDPLAVSGFRENPADRCYHCKKALFQNFVEIAKDRGIEHILEGSNMDDDGDYRPGKKAIKELCIESPLREAGLYKNEIRELSKEMGLLTWKKPSFACLASRFPYGERIDEKKLSMVERGEQLLLDLGFSQFRVRIHGNLARLEILPDEFEKLLKGAVRERVYNELKALGFSYVSMDLEGYRTGSMNEVLADRPANNCAR